MEQSIRLEKTEVRSGSQLKSLLNKMLHRANLDESLRSELGFTNDLKITDEKITFLNDVFETNEGLIDTAELREDQTRREMGYIAAVADTLRGVSENRIRERYLLKLKPREPVHNLSQSIGAIAAELTKRYSGVTLAEREGRAYEYTPVGAALDSTETSAVLDGRARAELYRYDEANDFELLRDFSSLRNTVIDLMKAGLMKQEEAQPLLVLFNNEDANINPKRQKDLIVLVLTKLRRMIYETDEADMDVHYRQAKKLFVEHVPVVSTSSHIDRNKINQNMRDEVAHHNRKLSDEQVRAAVRARLAYLVHTLYTSQPSQ